jgi:hypothetical protein
MIMVSSLRRHLALYRKGAWFRGLPFVEPSFLSSKYAGGLCRARWHENEGSNSENKREQTLLFLNTMSVDDSLIVQPYLDEK